MLCTWICFYFIRYENIPNLKTQNSARHDGKQMESLTDVVFTNTGKILFPYLYLGMWLKYFAKSFRKSHVNA